MFDVVDLAEVSMWVAPITTALLFVIFLRMDVFEGFKYWLGYVIASAIIAGIWCYIWSRGKEFGGLAPDSPQFYYIVFFLPVTVSVLNISLLFFLLFRYLVKRNKSS